MNRYQNLIDKAIEVRNKAYAPYSKFKVGAAVLCQDGSVFTGCNVENASFGLTCCAERIAIFNAVAAGQKNFTAVAIALESQQLCSPCGACRQVMAEFGVDTDLDVIICNLENGSIDITKLSDLLPQAFGSICLK